MTLNLIVMTPKRVYQCSDFRLTYSTGLKTDHEAQKIIAITTTAWTALIQFTGVAKNNRGFDTCQWLAELISRVDPYAPLNWLTDELLDAGRQIGTGDPHTFSAAGFADERPFVFAVSNFQGFPDMRITPVNRSWRLTWASGRHGAFATGSTQHVTSDDLRALKRNARKLPAIRVLEHLSNLNQSIAKKSGTPASSPISESCFAGSLSLNGKGTLIPYGVDSGRDYLPQFVLNLQRPPLRDGQLVPKRESDGKPIPRRLIQIALTLDRKIPAFMFASEFSGIAEFVK